jgi:hypothetical protein
MMPALGAGGRWFESGRPHLYSQKPVISPPRAEDQVNRIQKNTFWMINKYLMKMLF